MPDNRIRVLHVLSSARAGGVETFVLELARHIDWRRFQLDVCIVAPYGPIVEALCATGAAVHVLGDQNGYWHRALSYFIHLRAGRFDIVHVNIGGRLPKYLARLARRRSSLISHVHGAMIDEVEPWRQGNCSAAPEIMRNYVRGAQHLVASSHEIGRMLTTCCPAVAGRVSVIPHGVDLDRFRPVSPASQEVKASRRALGLSEGDAVVGFVGRLVPQKGLSYLLAAAELLQARYGNLRFVIVGDGPLRSELATATASSGTGRFCFLGERSDVPHLLALFDVLVVPSEWEPFGIVNLEAMAAGRPVVAFDVDGIPEAIVHGETGLLVPHRDSRALASAIARLLDDAPLRRRMGAAGRQRVEQRFNVRDMARAFESFYETAKAG
jgi:glycosyltransferase involved in cell wall biosynthesis